ncbi:AAA family ATPase [Vibrio breoganii]
MFTSASSFEQVRAELRGKELSILAGMGLELPKKQNVGAPCPACGGKDRFSWVIKGDKWVYQCRECGGGDAFDLITKIEGCPKKASSAITGVEPVQVHQPIKETPKDHSKAIRQAKTILDTAVARDDHPYLVNRGLTGVTVDSLSAPVNAGGVLFPKGSITLYLTDGANDVNVQLINESGDKRYLKDGQKKGCFHMLGADNPSEIYIVEGYATGVSVWQALNREQVVIVAFDAGNLSEVADKLRGEGLPLIFMADNDKSGVGQKKAQEAAKEGERVCIPPVLGDWDDYRQGGNSIKGEIERQMSITCEKKPERSLFKFVNGFEGFDNEFSYLIKGYLPMNSFGMVYGASGSFKSFHALSWAAHVALGKEWNGHRVNRAPVLYVAGEGGIGVPRRIKALADTYNNGNPIEDLYRLDHPVAMGDISEVNQLAHSIEHYSDAVGKKFGLVIVDTLARCFGVGDENRTDDMSRFVAACDRLKAQVGVTVLIVHHSGVQDKERARGSSALRAACDFEFRVERAKRETPALILASTKAKDDKEKPKQMFPLSNVTLFTDSDGDEVKSLVASNVGEEPPAEEDEVKDVKLSSNEQLVYQVVRARQQAGDPTTREIIRDDLKAQGTDLKHFSRWLNACLDKGVLACNDEIYSTVVMQ